MFETPRLRLLSLFITALLSPGTPAASATQDPPLGSWEAWLVALRHGQSPPPPRPDQKNISLPLPIWVDCHLSWAADRPKAPTHVTLSGEIVLVGSPALCKGQLEEWAVE